MQTVIRYYDHERIALLPETGVPEKFAIYLEKQAYNAGWTDLKIVKTVEFNSMLGVVCKPKTWVKLIKIFRKEGAYYPDNYEQEFLDQANTAMKVGGAMIEKDKVEMSDAEKDTVDYIQDRMKDVDVPEEEIEKEVDDWKGEKES